MILEQLPKELSLRQVSEERDDETLAFYSGFSVLSNFYKCKLVVDKKIYNSVEQYYCHKKALFTENLHLAEQVMKETDPMKIKKLTKKIPNLNKDQCNDIKYDVILIACMPISTRTRN